VRVARDFLKDACGPCADLNEGGPSRGDFSADCVQRLILQYPEIDLDPEKAHDVCARAPIAGSLADYWRGVLTGLRREAIPADAARYDLRGSDPAADFPEAGNKMPPPSSAFSLEDAPFVVPRPRALPAPGELRSKTLLLKSSADCYRLWMVRRMFPQARFKFVVLTRNPAGAISGLVDGWLSDAFYSQNLGDIAALDIKGYSRADLPWTTKWWNFDLPPGWSGAVSRSVEEVCALQWSSANEHILRDMKSGVIEDSVTVRYESLLEAESLARELDRVFAFAGLRAFSFAASGASPSIMSVTPPAPQKWRKRRDALAPLVSTGPIADRARELGYEPREWENWA